MVAERRSRASYTAPPFFLVKGGSSGREKYAERLASELEFSKALLDTWGDEASSPPGDSRRISSTTGPLDKACAPWSGLLLSAGAWRSN
jgi:hypothetical protein